MQKEFKEKQQLAQEIVYSFLPQEEGLQKSCLMAMNYSVKAPGKRLRPLLMMETYRMFHGEFPNKVLEHFMAALEFIHTYSLVHDDLPAMDNDEYRRGRKTTHIVYGHAMGILAGDALLNYAYETAIGSLFEPLADAERIGMAMKVLSEKAGIFGMVGGQVVDVENEGNPLSMEQLDFIYRLKTSALLECAMMIGAILAGATKKQVDEIEAIARNIGIAFQIQDDILDITSTTEVLGKPVGSDEKNQKMTYAVLKGVEQSAKDVEKLSRQAVEKLHEMKLEDEFVSELLLSLIHRKK
ncbi:MAG: polyprenyl synthetase family protein [Lachnospiraceae bacterium]|nr:polyprenyl synthetase family protein [Lachnospiraceae bacterium]